MSPEVVRINGFSLDVRSERGERHHLAHCHVRRRCGGAETVVSLPLLNRIAGPPLSRAERKALMEHADALFAMWERLSGRDD